MGSKRGSTARSAPARVAVQPAASAGLLTEAIRLHRAGEVDRAEPLYLQLLRKDPSSFEANLYLGTLYLEKGTLPPAVEHLGRSVRQNPTHGPARHYWALALEQMGQFASAEQAYEAALALGSPSGRLLVQSANFMTRIQKTDRASQLYGQAVTRDPNLAEAWHGLAELARIEGDTPKAETLYRRALAANPDWFPSLLHLGLLLEQEEGSFEAADLLDRAVKLVPTSVEARVALAHAWARQGRWSEGLALVAKLRQEAPDQPLVHEALAILYDGQGMADRATNSVRQAVGLRPSSVRYRMWLGERLLASGLRFEGMEQFQAAASLAADQVEPATALALLHEQADQIESAQAIYTRLGQSTGDELLWKLRSACAVRTILPEESEIDACRDRLQRTIDEVRGACLARTWRDLLKVGVMPPFNMTFHHRDDRPWRADFASMTAELIGHESLTGPTPATRSIPRAGFFCGANPRTFVRSIGGAISLLSPSAIDPLIVCPTSLARGLRSQLRGLHARVISLPDDPGRMLDQFRSLDLDLLVYFEVGTSPLGYLLAHHRIARVQVATWGIQVTTGIPTIDYYLSSKRIEVPEADAHYSERLVRADSLLTVFPQPLAEVRPHSRTALGLPTTGTIYLCPQQLGKFTPRFDALLARILRADPNGWVVITEGNIPELVEPLQARRRQHLPDVADRFIYVRQAKGNDYASLLKLADVLLDPIDFGGVNTTYDAFGAHKILVTIPSSFQRTRYATACYELLEITEPIADSLDQYVEKAVRWGTEPEARIEIERALADRARSLFGCRAAAEDMQTQLLAMARGEA